MIPEVVAMSKSSPTTTSDFETLVGLYASDDFIGDIKPTDLVYFLLDVGNGDAQILLLPEQYGRRAVVVVDVARFNMVDRLISALSDTPLLRNWDRVIEIAIATHPHRDHIHGMAKLLSSYKVREFWEPGCPLPSQSYFDMCTTIEDIRHTTGHCLPTSGYEQRIGDLVQLTVVAPSVALKHRFGETGFDVNNSSIALLVEYPKMQVAQLGRRRLDYSHKRGNRLLLGADAQTVSWAHVETEFPRSSSGDNLKADVFKVPHHGSKHGVNLELVERVSPKYSLISCAHGGGRHNFPHGVTQEILREAHYAIAVKGRPRPTDHELGIHQTSDRYLNSDDENVPLGTIAVVVGRARHDLTLWRLRDDESQINLTRAVCLNAVAVVSERVSRRTFES
ncbi:ComEC/Rec2 family competence protein [Streptomyces sp. NBC_01538]|uniref:ComEC/Rec2 family competence protein n=1 Tax=Streptomyces sp. NBC_01538 TaxID=2903897 RepID=UPI003869F96F